mmetsp:Transcript_18322/g.30558  ORF Transcript_18322/g.30558 Transcript_18322/m.30558 type:complete len:166 (-) Transcript_18322:1371-1868(-)
MVVKFKEYNTSDTVVEFVASNEEFPTFSTSLLFCSLAAFLVSPSIRIPATCALAVILYSMWNTVIEESITVIKEFGIQIKTKYLFYISEEVLFLDHDKIDGYLLQECIVGTSIKFHLAFMVSGENSLTVVFQHVYPGLSALQDIYNVLSPSTTESVGRTRHHNNG